MTSPDREVDAEREREREAARERLVMDYPVELEWPDDPRPATDEGAS